MRYLMVSAVLLGGVSAALAQDISEGDQVVALRAAQLKVGSEPVSEVQRGDVLRVKEVNDDWLWVTHRGSGWLHRQNVAPMRQAVAYFSEAIRRNPRDANAYLIRGYLWQEQGDLASAISDYDRAIQLNPQLALAYSHRGKVWAARGDFTKANVDFGKAIELAPGDPVAYNNRAAAYHQQNKLPEALADLNEAIRVAPDFALAYEHRGYTHESLGDANNAMADFTKALELNPKSGQVFKARGDLYKKAGRYADAVADFGQAIKLDPKNGAAYNSLAWLLATCPVDEVRDPERAVKQAQIACKLTDWNNGICLDTLAGAHAAAGDFEKAVAWQTKAIAASPDGFDTASAQARLKLYRAGKPYREEAPSE